MREARFVVCPECEDVLPLRGVGGHLGGGGGRCRRAYHEAKEAGTLREIVVPMTPGQRGTEAREISERARAPRQEEVGWAI